MPGYNNFASNPYQTPLVGGSNFAPYTPYQTGIPMQQAQPQVQQPSTNLMTIFVNSEEEVANYQVAAGLTVMLLSFNLKKFWLKSTNTNGVPQPIRVFPFTEEVQPTNIPTNNQNDSVTRDEFRALNEKLEKLINDLGGGK